VALTNCFVSTNIYQPFYFHAVINFFNENISGSYTDTNDWIPKQSVYQKSGLQFYQHPKTTLNQNSGQVLYQYLKKPIENNSLDQEVYQNLKTKENQKTEEHNWHSEWIGIESPIHSRNPINPKPDIEPVYLKPDLALVDPHQDLKSVNTKSDLQSAYYDKTFFGENEEDKKEEENEMEEEHSEFFSGNTPVNKSIPFVKKF